MGKHEVTLVSSRWKLHWVYGGIVQFWYCTIPKLHANLDITQYSHRVSVLHFIQHLLYIQLENSVNATPSNRTWAHTDCRVHSGVPKITTCFWPHLTQRWWLSCAVQASSIFLDHKIIKHHWKFDHGSLNFPHLGGIQQSAVCLFTRNSLSWGRGNSLVGCCGMYIAQHWYVHVHNNYFLYS